MWTLRLSIGGHCPPSRQTFYIVSGRVTERHSRFEIQRMMGALLFDLEWDGSQVCRPQQLAQHAAGTIPSGTSVLSADNRSTIG